jgi:alpha/beta superfamily hydrolase
MVFAIAWNMTEKPGTAAAILSIVVGYAVGAFVAMRMARMPAAQAAAATDPAA